VVVVQDSVVRPRRHLGHLGQRRRRRLGSALSTLALLLGLGFILLPVFWLVTTAFKSRRDAFSYPPKFIFHPTLDNFRTLFHSEFLADMGHSAILTALATGVALVLGVPAGYAFARSSFRGKGFISAWLLLSYVMPAVVFIIPMYIVFLHIGLTGTYWAMVLAYETGLLPFTVFMMRSYFLDVPRELDEAALVDGCTRGGAFWRVILPVTWPGVLTVGLLVAIASWGEYFGALVLSGPNTTTAPIAIVRYVGLQEQNWSAMAAGGVLVVVPLLLLAGFAQRGIIRGLTAGAVSK
jgi:multiple sugar transport system permease protein